MKINSEIDEDNSKLIFTLLKKETNILRPLNPEQTTSLTSIFKLISYAKGAALAKANETVDYIAIFISGSAIVQKNGKTLAKIGRGSIIGYMALLGVTKAERHYFDTTGSEDGIIAVAQYSEIKEMRKKNNMLIPTLFEFLTYYCYEELHFQLYSESLSYSINLQPMITPSKSIEKDFKQHKRLNEFIRMLSQKEMPAFFEALRYYEVDISKQIIKEKSHKKSLYFITSGWVQLLTIDGNTTQELNAPQVLGLSNFLYDHEWEKSIYAKTKCRLYELPFESYSLLKDKNVNVAAEILKGIIKFKEYEAVETNNKVTAMLINIVPEIDPKRVYELPLSKMCSLKETKSDKGCQEGLEMHLYSQFAATLPASFGSPTQPSPRDALKGSGFLREKQKEQSRKKSPKKGKKAQDLAQTMPVNSTPLLFDSASEDDKQIEIMESERREAETQKQVDSLK